MAASIAVQKFRFAPDLYEAGEQMQRMRRPAADAADIEAAVWRMTRPDVGDSAGRMSTWFM